MRILIFTLALLLPAKSDEPKLSRWNGFQKIDFQFDGKTAWIVKPATAAKGNPWIWRTEFFGHEPQVDLALLAEGWHVAYLSMSDLYGSPQAVEWMEKFHSHATKTYLLAPRVTLEGFSRGGLYAVNFASAHPQKTAALYLDAPVLDICSWPGGKGKGSGDAQCWQQAMKIYGLTEQSAKNFRGSPIHAAERLAKAGIPIISVCGDADTVVPLDENTKPFAERYRAAGGKIEVIIKPGVNHHPHSLKSPKPIVDFLLRETAQ